MSVATRTTLSIVAKSSWFLFYPSSSAGSSRSMSSSSVTSSTLALSSSSSSKQQDGLLWWWTAVGLGCLGFKLCNDALEVYRFCTAWNQVWRRNRNNNNRNRIDDIDGVDGVEGSSKTQKDSKEHLKRRRLEIERSLTTLTYGELLRKREQLFCGENYKGDDETAETTIATTTTITITEQQQQQQQQQNETRGRQQPQEAQQYHTSCSRESSSKHGCTLPQTPPLQFQPEEAETCVICLSDFEAGERVSCSMNFSNKTASCRHIFHASCLRAWLIKHVSCPVCRHRMAPDPEKLPGSPDL